MKKNCLVASGGRQKNNFKFNFERSKCSERNLSKAFFLNELSTNLIPLFEEIEQKI